MSDIRARIRSVPVRGQSRITTTAPGWHYLGRDNSWGYRFTSRHPRPRWHYYLSIYKGDVVINTDDCSDFYSLLADAERRVIKYRGMQNAGVRLRPWSELVDEAHT